VAFKLTQALLREHLAAPEADRLLDDLLELVAIGTLSDIVPLRGENRTIVRRGLKRLNATERVGLRALLAVAGLMPGTVDADRVCYAIAPRLNAAGRLDHARLSLNLLLSESADEAEELGQRLDVLNRARQAQTNEAVKLARELVGSRYLGPAIVVSGPFPLGIAGLVASRLVEDFNRPAIVLRHDEEVCSGSARSVAGLNVVEAMRRGAQHLDRFGGHAMAAGLSLRTEHLAEFETDFQEAVAEARGEAPTKRTLLVDAELRAATAARWSTLHLLPKLEPHGAANPAPTFLTRGLRVVERRPIGGDSLRLRVTASDASLSAIGFGLADEPFPLGDEVDLVYYLKRNVWRDTIAAELELLDWRTSGSCYVSDLPGEAPTLAVSSGRS
jgi:single-stranded-DNA-specific exonuclease